MDFSDEQNQKFKQKEQEIRAKEAEIRLRELELEISQQYNQNNTNIPHYETRKHEESPSSLKKLTKKIVKFTQFLGFTILTLALMRAAFFIGMWLAYGFLTMVILFVGYQIFIRGDN